VRLYQSYAGIEKDIIGEYPVELKSLAQDITLTKIVPDYRWLYTCPEKNLAWNSCGYTGLKKYLVDVEIKVMENKFIIHLI